MELTLEEINHYVDCLLAEQRIEIFEEMEDSESDLVSQLDTYLSDFAEDFISRYELDEKLEAIVVARVLKRFLTVKLPDEMSGRVKSLCELNGKSLNDQLVQLIGAGLEAQENA